MNTSGAPSHVAAWAARRHTVLACLASIAALAGALVVANESQDPPRDRSMRLAELRGGVYAVYGGGANSCVFIGADSVVVFDSKRDESAAELLRLIRGLSALPIRYLVNSTFDVDHAGGNAALGAAVVLGHANTRLTLLARPAQYRREYPQRLAVAERNGDADEAARLRRDLDWARSVTPEAIGAPVLTYGSSPGLAPWELNPRLKVHLGSETLHLWSTRAPDRGPSETLPTSAGWMVSRVSTVAYFETADLACLGDLFFNAVIPFEFGQLWPLDRDRLARLTGRAPDATIVVPGHGLAGSLAQLDEYDRYVRDVRRVVSRAQAAGLSREEFIESVELPAYARYEGYPERFKEHCAWQWDHSQAR